MSSGLRSIARIVVHHSESPRASTSFADVKRWHVKERGFADVGYHAVIDGTGVVHAGRPEHKVGAHAHGANEGSLGICLIGNFDREAPRPEQWSALVRALGDWCRRYGITPGRDTIIGHRDVRGTTKSCPGENLYRYLPWVRQQVSKSLVDASNRAGVLA